MSVQRTFWGPHSVSTMAWWDFCCTFIQKCGEPGAERLRGSSYDMWIQLINLHATIVTLPLLAKKPTWKDNVFHQTWCKVKLINYHFLAFWCPLRILSLKQCGLLIELCLCLMVIMYLSSFQTLFCSAPIAAGARPGSVAAFRLCTDFHLLPTDLTWILPFCLSTELHHLYKDSATKAPVKFVESCD